MISGETPAVADGHLMTSAANISDCCFGTSHFTRGFSYCGKLSAVGTNDDTKVGLVAVLHGFWNPLTIVGIIISIVVDAINRQICSIATCYCPIAKWFEALPLGTNGDPATTISRKGMASRISASLAHRVPDFEKSSSGLSMLSEHATSAFPAQATAGFGMTSPQVLPSNNLFVAAFTAATPRRVFWKCPTNLFNRRQSTKRLAGDIDELGQGDLLARLLCQVTGWRFNAGPSRILAQSIPA